MIDTASIELSDNLPYTPKNDSQIEHGKLRFLLDFRRHGIVTSACEIAGISRGSVMNWRRDDIEFSNAYTEAELSSTERMEREAIRRASEGWEHPVFQGGKLVGTECRYSDNLLMFVLKMRKPEYRDKFDVNVTGELKVLNIVIDAVPGHHVIEEHSVIDAQATTSEDVALLP